MRLKDVIVPIKVNIDWEKAVVIFGGDRRLREQ